jgi:hypothetical protein
MSTIAMANSQHRRCRRTLAVRATLSGPRIIAVNERARYRSTLIHVWTGWMPRPGNGRLDNQPRKAPA